VRGVVLTTETKYHLAIAAESPALREPPRNHEVRENAFVETTINLRQEVSGCKRIWKSAELGE
jgi:hypothetical protein